MEIIPLPPKTVWLVAELTTQNCLIKDENEWRCQRGEGEHNNLRIKCQFGDATCFSKCNLTHIQEANNLN